MTAPTPPHSLPPPAPPPEVFARARVRALLKELEAVDEPRGQALLHYELGSLHELRLDDRVEALAHYREASRRWPRFLPALLAQATLLERQARHADAAGAWRTYADATLVPRDRAAALCELGLLARDRLGDGDAAVAAWSEALSADPSCIAAALLLEQEWRSRGEPEQAELAVAVHARASSDPRIEACLLLELALSRERSGAPERAMELLHDARELGAEPLAVWLQLERLARQAGDHEARVQALRALAEHAAGLAALGAGDWACTRGAALHRETARVQLRTLDDARGALASYDAALALQPEDPLLLRERMLARTRAGDAAGALDDARRLLGALADDDPEALALQRELPALLREQGDGEAALEALTEAARRDRRSTHAQLTLEDELRRLGRWEALCAQLEARAQATEGAARAERLLQAARVALAHGVDAERTQSLLRAAIEAARATGEAPWELRALREAYAGALRLGELDAAGLWLRELLGRELPDGERGLLHLHDYLLRSRRGSPEAGLVALERAVDDPACGAWAPAVARVVAAQNGRLDLLARAHRALAARAVDPAAGAAHMAAAGRAALLDGARDAAEADLRAALELAPDDGYALALLEQVLLVADGAAEASELLREAAARRGDARERAVALLHAGAAAELAGDAETARHSYREAADVGAESPSPTWALLRLAVREGDAALRIDALRAMCEVELEGGGERSAHLELGEELAAAGDHHGAAAALTRALGDPGTEAAAAAWLGVLPDIDAGARRDARERAEASAEGALREALFTARLGDGLRAGDARAHELLDEASGRRPDDHPLLVATALHADDGGTRARALRELARTTADDATAAELSLHAVRCGLLSADESAVDDALVRAMGVGERAPRSLAAAVALDETLLGGDDPESRAAALFGRLAHTTPECAQPIAAARTRALLASGRAREAADAARRVLVERPDDGAAWEVLREAGAVLGDWDTVAEAAERLALQVDGRLRAALLEEASMVHAGELGDRAAARRALAAALESDPTRRSAFDRLHDLLLDDGELEGLLALLEGQLEHAARDEVRGVDLGHERALLLRALGRKEECLSALDGVLALQTDHTDALTLRAQVLRELERPQDAVSALRRLASLTESEELRIRARYDAAEILEHELDAPADARTELAAAPLRSGPDPERALRMARLAEKAGELRQAAVDYRAAAAAAPPGRRAELEHRAGTLLAEQLDDPIGARAAFEAALHAQPTHTPSMRALAALLSDEARERALGEFALAVQSDLAHEPENPSLLRALDCAGELRDDDELRLRALSTLEALALAEDDERRLLETAREGRQGAPLEEIDAALTQALDGRVHALVRAAAVMASASDDDGLDGIGVDAEREALAELPPAERFELARLCCARRVGAAHLLRGGRGAGLELLELVLAAADDGAAPRLRREARARLEPLPRKERRALLRLVEELPSARARCEAYLEQLEGACDRAALALLDDPAPALAATLGDGPVDLDLLAANTRALDLLRAWVSPGSAEADAQDGEAEDSPAADAGGGEGSA